MFKTALTSLIPSRFMANIGWLTGGEMVARLTRLVTAIVLARNLSPLEFGIAAVAITTFEIVRIFNENGIGAAIIRAPEDQLQALCKSAFRLGWAICISLAVIQTVAGAIIAGMTGRPELFWMIAVLSGVYLVMPAGLVHCWILQREQRMARIAKINAAQTGTDNLLTAALAIAGLGPWAIVLPKLLTAPIWLVGIRWGRPWRPDRAVKPASSRGLLTSAAPILASEVAGAARLHADKMIIGSVFGLEVLGVYYFAFNAGLGLSGALNTAFKSAIYPHLCEASRRSGSALASFDKSMRTGGLLLTAIFIAQAVAVPVYLPILFGQEWAFAAGLTAILCLCGPARLLLDACGLLLRASHQAIYETLSVVFASSMALAALAMGAQISLEMAGLSMAASLTLAALILFPVSRQLACGDPQFQPLKEIRP